MSGRPPALLVLADGTVFRGESFGAATPAYGEVVFNTSMIGYQKILTDPSYAGQIVALTYPLIGNYGISDFDVESKRIQVRGFVVREPCWQPSHAHSRMTLHDYLADAGIPAIAGIDTRALTRRIRRHGVLMGAIASETSADDALTRLRAAHPYDDEPFVDQVTAEHPYDWPSGDLGLDGEPITHIVLLDLGVKYNIMRILSGMGCRVTAVPASTSADDILALEPDGVLISPGPGDPAFLDAVVATSKGLVGRTPIFGICLGHQVLGRVFGASTYKLKFGHRGGNHPVQDLATGLVTITAQNHGYAVDPAGLSGDAEVSHINLNDGTVEGLRHRSLPIMAIQYHAEASPGPEDDRGLFHRFLALTRKAAVPIPSLRPVPSPPWGKGQGEGQTR